MKSMSTWTALQLIYGEALSDIERMFGEAGFHYMPIKGAYLIRTGLASTITDRKMVDIDILIRHEEFDEVCSWFASQKDVIPRDNYWDFERSFFITVCGNPIYLEFHRLINFPSRFLLPNEVIFAHGKKISKSCIVPDPTDALLIHICHKLAHVIDGFEEQFYREITLYASQEGFSWEVFWERARETGILGFIWLVVEKWRKLTGIQIVLPETPSLYAKFLSKYDLFMRGTHPIVLRLFFEVPFVRNVFFLLSHKINKLDIKMQSKAFT